MSKTKTSKFFKATTAVAVAASAVAVAVPAVTEASTLSDIKPGYQFYDAIMDLQDRGIIKGFPDGTYKPDNHLTRGQAAKIIAGVLGLNTTNVVDPGFKDIPKSHQYYGPIAALAQAGIITGYEDNTYRQAEKIQRNHVAKIIAGAMGLTASNPDDLPFTDVRADYKEAIAALFENGVTTGKTPTTFAGHANVTRGQMAAFIVRAEQALQNETPGEGEVIVQGNTITFTVADYENNTIVIGENSYTYDASVRPIFTQANKAALAGATMTVTVHDGAIKSVDSITLNKSGYSAKPLVFAAGDATIKTFTVNANYVSVKNLKVSGDATVTNKATDKVEFTGVAITGNLIIDNKGVVATASTDNKFAQDEKGIEVVINDTTAANIIIRALATLSGKANPALVTVEGPIKVTISIEGTIATLTVKDAKGGVTLGAKTLVTTLNIPAGTKVEDIIANFAAVAKQITKTVVGGSTTGGGGSGGSGGGSTSGGSSTTAIKAELNAWLTTADSVKVITAANASDVPEGEKWVTDEVQAAFKKAIEDARLVFDNKKATKSQVSDAIAKLKQAIETYEKAKQVGTKTDSEPEVPLTPLEPSTPVDPDPVTPDSVTVTVDLNGNNAQIALTDTLFTFTTIDSVTITTSGDTTTATTADVIASGDTLSFTLTNTAPVTTADTITVVVVTNEGTKTYVITYDTDKWVATRKEI